MTFGIDHSSSSIRSASFLAAGPAGHGLALLRGVVRRQFAPPAQRRRRHVAAVAGGGGVGARLPGARHRGRGLDQLGGRLGHHHRAASPRRLRQGKISYIVYRGAPRQTIVAKCVKMKSLPFYSVCFNVCFFLMQLLVDRSTN